MDQNVREKLASKIEERQVTSLPINSCNSNMKDLTVLLPILFALCIVSCSNEPQSKLNHVMDRAGILTEDEEADLTKQILELEDSIGSQLIIFTIDSLGGEKIEDFALRHANEWEIGRKDYDDGILIVVAVHDREMRIEVGYGLELIVKDEIASRILHEQMAPEFREEKYHEGLQSAVETIKTLIMENRELVGKRPY